MFFVKVYIKLVCVKDDLINDFNILEDIMGIFLENNFWTPPPPPINFVHGSYRKCQLNLTRGRSARPPSPA